MVAYKRRDGCMSRVAADRYKTTGVGLTGESFAGSRARDADWTGWESA